MGKGGKITDISIVDPSGSADIGFMLVKDKGVPVYQQKEMSSFNALQATGYIDEASQNPEAMYPISFQKSWVGGYGQAFMKSDEPRRYYAAYGVDASIDGQLQLGPDWTAVNWPTVTAWAALVDGGVENWASASDLTSWTETIVGGASSVSQQTSSPHGGTYWARCRCGSSASSVARIQQSIYGAGTLPADMQGKKFRFAIWGKVTATAGSPTFRIRIYDGVGYTSRTISGASWANFAVIATLNAAATELTVICEATGSVGNNGDLDVDDCTLTGYAKSSSYNCYAEYNGLQYLSVGDILYKANSATAPTSWTYVDNFYGDNITALLSGQVSGTAYLFIMVGAGNGSDLDGAGVADNNGYYYDGTTVTQMTDAGGTDASGDYITSATTTVIVFYIAGRPTGVTTGAKCVIRNNDFGTGLTDAWSGDTYVGDANTNINSILTGNNVVYICKEDAAFKVNTDGTVSIIVDYRMLRSSTSGSNVTFWNGKLYIPVGVNSLIEYDPDTATYSDISPASSISSATQAQISVSGALLSSVQADFDGRIMAVAGGNEWLWLLQDNGSVNNLFKGRYANIDSTGWHWHPVANTTMADVNAMYVSALTGAPIIWAAHGTGNPGYYDLAKYETTDPTYTVPMIITPFYTGGVWRMMKALYSVILGLETITATVYVTLQYRFYGTTAWSTALTFDGTAGTVANGQDSNYMPADSFGTAIQFRLNFVSGANTSTPKVTRINGEGVIRPAEVTLYDFLVKLIDDQVQLNGVRDGTLASRKATCLDNARANSWPVTMYDIGGNTRTVDVLSRELTEWQREYGLNPTFTYHVMARKVTLS